MIVAIAGLSVALLAAVVTVAALIGGSRLPAPTSPPAAASAAPTSLATTSPPSGSADRQDQQFIDWLRTNQVYYSGSASDASQAARLTCTAITSGVSIAQLRDILIDTKGVLTRLDGTKFMLGGVNIYCPQHTDTAVAALAG